MVKIQQSKLCSPSKLLLATKFAILPKRSMPGAKHIFRINLVSRSGTQYERLSENPL